MTRASNVKVGIFLYTLLTLSENPGRLTWGKLQQPQEQRYPILQVHGELFSCFRNPPNSNMDYRIFNVLYAIILIRA